MQSTTRLALIIAATTAVLRTPCAAQVEISPFAGVYVPAGPFVNGGGVSPAGSSVYSVQQDMAPAGGVRLLGWVRDNVALTLAVAYSPSGTTTQGGSNSPIPVPGTLTYEPINMSATGSVVTGSARALFFVRPDAARRPSTYFIAGLGWLSHNSGNAAGAKTDFGPDLGAGLRLPLTPTIASWVEGQILTFTALAPNLLFSVGVSTRL